MMICPVILAGMFHISTIAQDRRSFEDTSFLPFNRYSNRAVVTITANFEHRLLENCPSGFLKIQKNSFGTSLSYMGMDSICIRLASPSDTIASGRKFHVCTGSNQTCKHELWRRFTYGWTSLKAYKGCKSTSSEFDGGADFALNLNDSLALAVTVTAIAGGKHLGKRFLDSLPEESMPVYTAEIATSRMLCEPGSTTPNPPTQRTKFNFGTYPKFRLFRVGGGGILVMSGRDLDDPSRTRVMETTITDWGYPQSRQYFEKVHRDGLRLPLVDYKIQDGILYRKIVDPERASGSAMDQGWVGRWVDRFLVPDYLKEDSATHARVDSASRSTTFPKVVK